MFTRLAAKFHLSWCTLVLGFLASSLAAQTTTPPSLQGLYGGGTIELGQRLTLGVQFYGTPVTTGYTYQWRKNGTDLPGETNPTFMIGSVTSTDAGTYAVTVSNSAGASVASTAVTVKNSAAPAITTQPRDTVTQVGQQTNLFVVATGSYPRTYQWYKDGTAITGATSSFYSINAAALSDVGSYYLTISNSLGSVTSSPASLTVNAATPIVMSTTAPTDSTFTEGASGSLWAAVNSGSTPITYQWRKDGVAIDGATTSQFSPTAWKLTDAGRYSVIATNPAGSVTSREAVVTVTAATPIVFGAQPQSQTVFEGQQVNWNLYPSAGSQPITYQWRKDGVPIAGATNPYYSITAAKQADAGDYTLLATNAAGSVVTNVARLTVSAAIAPTLTSISPSQTIPYRGTFTISANVAGTPPFTWQFTKDGGAPFSNYNNNDYYVSNATPANSGTYTMTVSNAAGSVTTPPIVITVLPAAKVVMTQQPKDVQAAEGQRVQLTMGYTTVGAGNYGVQWYKDGQAIPGAMGTYTNFSWTYIVDAVKPSDAGVYYAVITSEGGPVTTSPARISVLPPESPSMDALWNWPQTTYGNLGEYKSFNISTYGLHGSPPFTYQWYKDGQPIANATTSGYSMSALKDSDFGTYTVTIANTGGIISSPPFEMRQYATKPTWVAAERFGDIVYFLATAPNRIERYDLVNERWLSSTVLNNATAPTALLPTADGVYLAYGRALVRRTHDLATETPLVNAVSDIVAIFASGNYVYYTSYTTSPQSTVYTTKSIDRISLEAGPGLTQPVHLFGAAPGKGVVFAAFDGGINQRLLRADAQGQLSETNIAADSTVFPTGSRLFVAPNEEFVANRGGSIFRLDTLAYAGSFGPNVADVGYLADSTAIVLRDRKLQAMHASTFHEVGAATIPFRGSRVFVANGQIFVFGGLDVGTTFQVAKVAATALTEPALTSPTIADGERYSIDNVFLGADGVVHIFSRTKQALLRWSSSSRSFLSSVPLRGMPALANQTDGANRAWFSYLDGAVTNVPLGANAVAESQFSTMGNGVTHMTDLSNGLLVNASNTRFNLDDQGRPLFVNGSNQWRTVIGWNPTLRRIYSGPLTSYDDHTLRADVVASDGSLGTSPDNAVAVMDNVTGPIRFNTDASLMATANGRVLNADLVEVGVLSTDILDAAWLPENLYTLRAKPAQTEVQRWSRKTHLQNGATTLPGTPLRVFRLSDTQLVVVTNVVGRPFFTVLQPDLTVSAAPTPTEVIATQPASQALAPDAVASLAVETTATTEPLAYQWRKDGIWLAGESGTELKLGAMQPATSGLYSAVIASQATNESSDVAIVGVSSADKVLGTGHEVGKDIVHPNGNVYDQVLLEGKAVSVTADPGQVVRTSFVDLSNDIVQVEFAGAGTLSLVLDQASDPAPAVNYNQPTVNYVKGHARIVITGADETTNVSVFTVGKKTAVNQSLFVDGVTYDGVADIASIAILSRNGKFGGVRAANVNFVASDGLTGIYAPNVTFTGPVYVGDITAYDASQATLVLGAASDVRITGGSLLQPNDRAVNVDGFTSLQFTDGSSSNGDLLPAQTNLGRLVRAGQDVTSDLTAKP